MIFFKGKCSFLTDYLHIHWSIFFLLLFLASSCEKKPYYNNYTENLTGEIEKEWHLDSISIDGDRQNIRAAAACISDDKFIFRYDNTVTFYNNQTQYLRHGDSFNCRDTLIYDILLWDITEDTLLNLNGKVYKIDSLSEYEMVLRMQNQSKKKQMADSLYPYDYEYYYARESDYTSGN